MADDNDLVGDLVEHMNHLDKKALELKRKQEAIKLKYEIPHKEWFSALAKIRFDMSKLQAEREETSRKAQAIWAKCPPHKFEYKGLANRALSSAIGVVVGAEQKAHFVCSKGCGEVLFK